MLKNSNFCIVGLGTSGQAVAAYLAKRGMAFYAADSRKRSPELEQFKKSLEPTGLLKDLFLGEFEPNLFCRPDIDILIVSPGVPCAHLAIQQAKQQGKKIIGDIELFAQEVGKYCPNHKVVGITGSNGKSTVTTLVGALLIAYATQKNHLNKIKVVAAGNIGLPVLTALDNLITETPNLSEIQVYFVLELSSFQLETTHSLSVAVACILNISPNHLDRYENLTGYIQAKKSIYQHAQAVVYNREDKATYPDKIYLNNIKNQITFGLGTSSEKQFGLCVENNQLFLASGQKKYIPVSDLKLMGRHNYANSLAALAIIKALNIEISVELLEALKVFSGLPHRCEWVADINHVQWINDSKATSIGAVKAAVEGIAPYVATGKVILIAGGDGKGADFREMVPVLEKYVQAVILIGRDAHKIAEVVPASIPKLMAEVIDKAVLIAQNLAKPGDTVLLSPICASWDQYPSYIARGEHFKNCVLKLI